MKLSKLIYFAVGITLLPYSSGLAEESAENSPAESAATFHSRVASTVVLEPGAPVLKTNPCTSPEIQPNSASPTWDTPAETTPCGALETDNLVIAQPLGDGIHQEMIVSTAKYGLTPHLEIRWGLPGHLMQSGGGTRRLNGTTDQWLGVCYRFRDQGRWMPDLALDYAIKIPTANPAKGFGTGYVDHNLTFIASRDLGQTHIDFNAVGTIAGGSRGEDGSPQFGMALTRPVNSRLLWTLEAYGGPQPGTSDRYGAVLAGGAWNLRPWFTLNSAYVQVYTAGSPRRQYLFGVIYTMRPAFAPPGSSRLGRFLRR